MSIGSVPGAGSTALPFTRMTSFGAGLARDGNRLVSGDDHLISRYAEQLRPFSAVLTKDDKRMLARMYQMAEQSGGKAGAEVGELAQAIATQRWAEKAQAEAKARALGKPVVLRPNRHDEDLDAPRPVWVQDDSRASSRSASPVTGHLGQIDLQA